MDVDIQLPAMPAPSRPYFVLLIAITACHAVGCGEDANFVQHGEASFYADKFEGEPTANGEAFRQDELTAAHKDLPLGTEARVIHDETGNHVTVRINDRGPFVEGRIIDLSKRAWRELGLDTEQGVVDVTVKANIEPAKAEALRSQLDNAE